MNGVRIQEVLENLYPISYAEDWDNVGLQVGTMDKEIDGILISLDLTKEVIKEAIGMNANLIICHHPAIFSPIKKIDFNSYLGQMIRLLIKNDITLYVMHTNFDVSKDGMNLILGNKLGIKNMTFFDIIDDEFGLGIVGNITPIKADRLISDIKSKFQIESVKFIGELDTVIEKVALVGGSGSSLLYKALDTGVDLFITGDVTYHKALDAKNLGLNVLDIGHFFEFEGFKELPEILKSNQINLPINISKKHSNPYKKM